MQSKFVKALYTSFMTVVLCACTGTASQLNNGGEENDDLEVVEVEPEEEEEERPIPEEEEEEEEEGGEGEGEGGEGEGEGEGEEEEEREDCQEDAFLPEEALPARILLVVDKSGSMDDGANGFDGSKWEGAQSALSSVLTSLDDDVEFGLMMYPEPEEGGFLGIGGDNCALADGVDVGVGPSNGIRIATALGAAEPDGGTPTAAVLVEAKLHLDSLPEEGGARALVLVTDGTPTCSEPTPETCTCPQGQTSCEMQDCIDDGGSAAIVRDLNSTGYPTFVVGFPGQNDLTEVLGALARAGGTETGNAVPYYEGVNPASVTDAVANISARISTCRFDLEGDFVLREDVSVMIGGEEVARDTNRELGWDFVDDNTIELFGTTCQDGIDSTTGVVIDYCFEKR